MSFFRIDQGLCWEAPSVNQEEQTRLSVRNMERALLQGHLQGSITVANV